MASNLKDAKTNGNGNGNGKPALKNSDPLVIMADNYRDRIAAHKAEITAGMSNLTGITSGDAGYVAGRAATKELSLSFDELAAWNPSVETNAIQQAVLDAQNDTCPADRSPRTFNAYSDALLHAVCASDAKIAEEARVGKGTDSKPQFGAVRARKFSAAGAPKANTVEGDQGTAAKAIAANLVKFKSDPEMLAIWTEASNAVGNVVGLRTMAAKVASIGVNVGRWKNYLFMGVCANAIDQYVTEDHLTTVGRVWQPTLAAARRAHGKFIGECVTAGKAITADELKDAIDAAIAEALEPHRGIKGRTVLEGEDQKKAVREKLFRALREADELWTGYGLVRLVNFEISRKSDEILAEDGLFDPKDKAMADKYAKLTGGVVAADTARIKKADAIATDQDAAKNKAKAARAASAEAVAAKAAVAGKPGNKPAPAAAADRLGKLKQAAAK